MVLCQQEALLLNLTGKDVCFDLKSATDRWPLLLLFEIMAYCFDGLYFLQKTNKRTSQL